MMGTPKMATHPVLTLDTGYRKLPGMAYGLAQPVIMVKIHVAALPGLDLPRLDAALRRFVTEPYPIPAMIEMDAARGLLERLHYWHSALQREYGVPVFGVCRIGNPRPDPEDARAAYYPLVLPCVHARASQAALEWMIKSINLLVTRDSLDQEEEDLLQEGLLALRSAFEPVALGSTNTIHFLAAAAELGMQVTRLAPDLYLVGQGRFGRRLLSSITDATPAIGARMAGNKLLSAQVLSQFGMPVPFHVVVESEEQAVAAAGKIGYPVVVKPAGEEQGRGVFAGLRSESSVRRAYNKAARFTSATMVEKHYHGEDFRFTVAHGQVVKIMHRKPGGVTGDGRSSIAALVAEVQATPEHIRSFRRQAKHRLDLDEEAVDLLQELGLGAESVPEAGRFVPLRRKSNISTGGDYSILPVESAHPDNCELAADAAHALGLDLAGIDIIMQDLTSSWRDTESVICEVNAQPQIGFRDTPEVFIKILRKLMGGNGRIPCHLLLIEDAEIQAGAELCQHWATRLNCNAWASVAGTWIEGRRCQSRSVHSFAAARTLLINDRVKALVFAMSPADILRFGLPTPYLTSIRVHADRTGESGSPVLRQALAMIESHTEQIVWLTRHRRTPEPAVEESAGGLAMHAPNPDEGEHPPGSSSSS